MADVEGVNIKVTADTGQAVKAVEQFTQATEQIKDKTVEVKLDGKMDSLGKLHKANGQFMTMGEKLAEKFSSSFMKSFANIAPSIDKAGQQIAAVTGKIDSYINRTVMAVVGAIGYVTKNALSIGGGFEAQMTNVKVISGATGQELDALTKKAREMGATLPITAKDAAQAMELLAQRGTKARDILASVADVSALAISQSIDMATSADLIGTTITNFGLSVEDASKITDIFNNASNQSAMNISKLVAAMKYVGPAAGALEIPLEKAVALMEAAANAGLTGEMIGTGLAMIFTKISSSANILGVSTRNLDGSLRDMSEIFSDLATKGMTVADANIIFGQRAGKTAIALVKHSQTLLENEKNVQKWGATQNAVIEKMNTWPNVWAAFQSAVEEVHIEIFDQIKEQSKSAVSSVANFTRIFSEWVNKTQLAGKAFNGFLSGLGLDALKNFDLRKFLDKLDIGAITRKFEEFGYFIKYTANTFQTVYKWIRIPLLFLIDHLTAFSVINFWFWLGGKGMSFATTLLSIAGGIKQVYVWIKALTAAKILAGLTSITTFLSNPALFAIAGIGAVTMIGADYYDRIDSAEAKKRLEKEKEKIQAELEELKKEINFDLIVKIKTGFEADTEALAKAPEELKEQIETSKAYAKERYIQQIFESTQAVNSALSEYAGKIEGKFEGTVEDINSEIATKLTKALQGDITTLEDLNFYWLSVLEDLRKKRVQAGSNIPVGILNKSLDVLVRSYKKARAEKEKIGFSKTEADFFNEDIFAGLKNALSNIQPDIERFQKLLGGNDTQKAVKASYDKAAQEIRNSIQKISKERNIPEDITLQGAVNILQKYAAKGIQEAQILINYLNSGSNEIDSYISKAQDYIHYLGAAPEKFLPFINSVTQGIQKIDPVTGKVTEKFKALYDAGKQLGSLMFDNLSKRIQNIRKAFEGGFIDKSALEREYKNALSQITLQVKTELEPTKGQYKSQADYESVVASEVSSRMFEVGGDIFAEKIKSEFGGQTGAAMGHALLVYLQKELKGDNAPIYKVNGVKQETQQINDRNNEILKLQQVAQSFDNMATKFNNLNINIPTQEINNAVAPLVTSLDRNTQSQTQTQIRDYTSSIAQIVSEIKILTGAVVAVENAIKAQPNNNISENSSVDLAPVVSLIQNLVQVNSNNGSQIVNALSSLNNATTNNYNIEVNQTGFNVQQKSDADRVARSTASAIQVGLGNGGV